MHRIITCPSGIKGADSNRVVLKVKFAVKSILFRCHYVSTERKKIKTNKKTFYIIRLIQVEDSMSLKIMKT